jgi:hypothetical protein
MGPFARYASIEATVTPMRSALIVIDDDVEFDPVEWLRSP